MALSLSPSHPYNGNTMSAVKTVFPNAALMVELGRPTRLCFSPKLIRAVIRTIEAIITIATRKGKEGGRAEREGETRKGMSLNLSTSQVLIELQLDSSPSPTGLQQGDSHCSFSSYIPASVATREGVLLSWDDCTVVYPHSNSQGTCAHR